MVITPSGRWLIVVISSLVGTLGLTATSVKADRLDDSLNKKAPEIVEFLRQHGIKNVGILRFRVKQGNHAENFQAGPINSNLVERLENALILHMGPEEKEAVGIIHDAGREASLRRIADWYGNPEDRKKLFAISTYPLAWSDKKVNPDAFLTGILRTSPDLKRATLLIESFTAATPAKLDTVAEFSFDTDISLFRDLGKSFRLDKRSVKPLPGRSTAYARRDMAIDEIQNHEVKPETDGNVQVAGIEFKLLAGDTQVPIKKSSSAGTPALEVECPDASQAVVFSLHNTSDKKLGVDVKVNGTSLLLEQKDEAEKCRLWVVDPGKTYLLKGWYLNEESTKNVAPFKILVGDEAKQMKDQLGSKAGDIDINVFESTGASNTGDDLVVSSSLRGLSPRNAKEARRSYQSYRRSLLVASKKKTETITTVVNGQSLRREIIVEDTDAEKRADQKLGSVEFPNRKVLESITIKVLPRQQETGGGDSSITVK